MQLGRWRAMSLPHFEYQCPSSIDEAVAILRGDADARALAGGQTLIPTLKQRLTRPSVLVDLRTLPELRGISVDEDAVTVGAMTRHAETASNPELRAAIPALSFLAGGIAHPQVRHMGTLGGSIANNDPAADYPAALVGLGAEIETTSGSISADSFFTGLFSTALKQGELVLRVRFPPPRGILQDSEPGIRLCDHRMLHSRHRYGGARGGERGRPLRVPPSRIRSRARP
jgi:aerobic carbon-monoxide dehydrogenase medium subunit